MMQNIVTCTSQDCTCQSTFSPATQHYQYRLFVTGYLNDHMAGFSAAFYSKSWGLVNLQDKEFTTMKHTVNFAKGSESALLWPRRQTRGQEILELETP